MLNMLLTTFICNNIAALLLKMFLVLVFSIFFVFQGVTLQKVVITDPNWIDDMVTGCADVPVDSDPSIINLTTPDTTHVVPPLQLTHHKLQDQQEIQAEFLPQLLTLLVLTYPFILVN